MGGIRKLLCLTGLHQWARWNHIEDVFVLDQIWADIAGIDRLAIKHEQRICVKCSKLQERRVLNIEQLKSENNNERSRHQLGRIAALKTRLPRLSLRRRARV